MTYFSYISNEEIGLKELNIKIFIRLYNLNENYLYLLIIHCR